MPRQSLFHSLAAAFLLTLCLPIASMAQDETSGEEAAGWQERFDTWFGDTVVDPLNSVLFFPVYSRDVELESGETLESDLPLIVVVLVLGGLFYTFRYGFLNVRLFGHAIAVIRGKFDDPNAKGEVSHFKALTAALSATVGLGNIAGVAVAITVGGPGAVFWMWVTAFFGMSMKFSSCVCAQLYRQIHEDGRVLIRETVRHTFVPCLYASLTTVAGFCSLVICDILPVVNFGYMMMMGLCVSMAVTFTLLPAGLALMRKPAVSKETDFGAPFTSFFARLTEKRGWEIVIVSLILTAVTTLGITRLQVENSFIDYFDESTEIRRGMTVIDEKLGGTTPLEVVLVGEGKNYWLQDENRAKLREIHTWLD